MRVVEVKAVKVERYGSRGVVIHHPIDGLGLLTSSGPAVMVTANLDPGGVIGRHPATGRQALAVVSGTIEVWGGDGTALDLTAGQLVMFEPGEEHETRAVTAATLAIMEWAES
jgi:quercetin dioxygenase-like cupin family protein